MSMWPCTSWAAWLSASDGSGSGVSTMRFSQDGTSWTAWETYGTSKSWTLTTSDGTKTVYDPGAEFSPGTPSTIRGAPFVAANGRLRQEVDRRHLHMRIGLMARELEG